MIKQIKKGFTLVELVIVIAVIAILASILIPTFTNLINEANEASDTALVKNMNTILATEYDESPQLYGEVLQLMENNGFLVKNMSPSATGNRFIWDQEHNRFIYVDEDSVVIYSDYYDADVALTNEEQSQLWLAISDEDEVLNGETYCLYYAEEITDEIVAHASVDTGYTKDANVTVTYGSTGAVNASFYGSFASLVIDNEYMHAENYSSAKEVEVLDVSSSSYIEYGYVQSMTLSLTTQNFTVGAGGYVDTIEVTSAVSNFTIASGGTVTSLTATSTGSVTSPAVSGTLLNSEVDTVTTKTETGYTLSLDSYFDLVLFANRVNGGLTYEGQTVELTANVDLTGKVWVPIGYAGRDSFAIYSDSNQTANANYGVDNYYFAGTFDGNEYTITGLSNKSYTPTYYRTDDNINDMEVAFGFFGLTQTATITDLNFTNVDISNSYNASSAYVLDSVGAIAGYANGGITVTNCTVSGSIQGTSGLGGLVGRIYGYGSKGYYEVGETTTTFTDCTNNSNVSGESYNIGGFVGMIGSLGQTGDDEKSCGSTSVSFINCVNNGNVSTELKYADKAYDSLTASGFANFNTYSDFLVSIVFEDCESNGTISNGDGVIAGNPVVFLYKFETTTDDNVVDDLLDYNYVEYALAKTVNSAATATNYSYLFLK